MSESKPATTAFPVHDLVRDRWSPRAFADRDVSPEALGSVLEAARWAASSYNEQPWRFVVARRSEPDEHAALLSCLVPANQAWAAAAPVLIFSVAHATFARNGRPNAHAWHDVGLASAQLALQAQALGLATHFMAGYDAARAREVLTIPEGWDPVAAIALGYAGDPESLPENLAAAERAPRTRLALGEVAFRARFGAAFEPG